MKTCQLEKSSHLESANASLHKCCQNTLDILKEKPLKMLFQRIVHNWKTRSRLNSLTETELKDLGITAADVDHEVRKPVWK